MNAFLIFKSIHFIGFVAWFGGLFYLVRIFVYHRESFDRPDIEKKVLVPQFELMEDRVYRIICNPAMVITWVCGLALLYLHGAAWLKVNTWMQIKLVFLIGMTWYQFHCKGIIAKLKQETAKMDSFQYRLFNEVPTLFLFAIVFLAVFRNMLHSGLAFGGLILFGVILYLFAKRYKSIRQK